MMQEFPCYYDLYVPAGNTPKPLIIALHGYGGDKSSMLRLMRNINEQDFVIAALQGPHQHMIIPKTPAEKLKIGFGWLTNYKAAESVALHHRNVRQIIATLIKDGIADPANIFLLGFSQAVGVNFRFESGTSTGAGVDEATGAAVSALAKARKGKAKTSRNFV